MGFAENLRSELNFQGMIVKELAARTHISVNTLHHYLHGKKSMPPADAACKIAAALGVTVEYLVLKPGTAPESRPDFRPDFRPEGRPVDEAVYGAVVRPVDGPVHGAVKSRLDAAPPELRDVLSHVALLSECWGKLLAAGV